MAVVFLVGLLSVIFCIPAFSKKGLYFAITARVSTYGVGALVRVSCTILAPSPMVRYFGWMMTLEIVLSWFLICWNVVLVALFLPWVVGGGWL